MALSPSARNLARPAFADPADWLDHEEAALDLFFAEVFSATDVEGALERLNQSLHKLRDRWPAAQWKRFCLEVAAKHPLHGVLQQCPFTSHGFRRPRGYPGDAELIDYLYADEACPQDRIGSAIYRYIHRLPSAVSVRERRSLLAGEIDRWAEQTENARILSVACGHLREAELSKALQANRVAELIALDADPKSLQLISRDYPRCPVRPVHSSIRPLLTEKLKFENLDFIYSAGLFDYLSAPVARRLTARLFAMVRSGGELLVGNFARFPPEVGYMEAFMDWWLIYRTEQEVLEFAGEIDRAELASLKLFYDSGRNVIYLRLTRR
jgi:extracellular factor (EF) 3-hydroxypalmitic acid methyl ester biosynthesis protein